MRTVPVARGLVTLALLGASAALLPGSLASAVPGTDDHLPSARAVVRNVSGTSLGTVNLQQVSSTRIAVVAQLSGLTAGFHGFHVHSVGICNPTATDPTGAVVPFITAGGHLNPGAENHGAHAGDMPALFVARNGTTRQVIETDDVTFANIFDADGSAIIVHAGADNLANIPTRYSAAGVPGPDAATLATGDAGGRFACGVVTRS